MWQPNIAQWRAIWPLAVLLVVIWPAEQDRSLGVKAINWLADPMATLPRLPDALARGLDDDGDAVTAHDMQMAEYDRQYHESRVTRIRLQLRDLEEPFNPSTERQILAAFGVLGGLFVWRLGGRGAGG